MISVIVPIYKTEAFLSKCLDSIVNQTYRDLEIILVDDGSPDNCGEICDDYAKKDDRIKVIHKENGGRSSARNAGLYAATGEYFAFVDSDDWLDPDMYETLIRIAEENGSDITECSYRYYRPWKTVNKTLQKDDTKEVLVFTNKEALEKLYFGPQRFSDISISVCNKLYRASVFKNLRFTEGYMHEDVEFTPKALFAADKIVKYDATFYTYNIHLGEYSTTGMKNTAKKVWCTIYMRQRVAEFFKKNVLWERLSNYALNAYYSSLIDGYYECAVRKNDEEFRKLQYYLKSELKKNKQDILAKNERKYKIFFFSHTLYVCMVWGKRTAKKIRYKIRVKLTGRN